MGNWFYEQEWIHGRKDEELIDPSDFFLLTMSHIANVLFKLYGKFQKINYTNKYLKATSQTIITNATLTTNI